VRLRRVHVERTVGRGLTVGEEAVWLLIRKAGLQGPSGRPNYQRIPNQPDVTLPAQRDMP
jgi:putative transposase